MEDHHLFICTGSTCTQQGAEEILHHIQQRLQARNIKNVCLTLVRCLGQCGEGPNIVLYGKCNPPEGIWHGHFTEEEMDCFITRHLLKEEDALLPMVRA